jgi:hypothetical protein
MSQKVQAGARYRSMKTSEVFRIGYTSELTYAQTEERWREMYNKKSNSHCYEFLESWTPGLFDDENKT